MFPNQPMVALHGEWRLPSNLVVLPPKRFRSGAMDSKGMVEEMCKAGVMPICFDEPLDRAEIEQVKVAEETLGNGTHFAERGRL